MVNIDLQKVGITIAKYVREQALKTGSFITYKEKNKIIRENPRTGEKFIINPNPSQVKG